MVKIGILSPWIPTILNILGSRMPRTNHQPTEVSNTATAQLDIHDIPVQINSENHIFGDIPASISIST